MSSSPLRTLGSICALLLAGLAATPADSAPLVFDSRLVRDLESDGAFSADVKGSVTIRENGDVEVTVKGLEPSTTYICRVSCSEGFADAQCTTNSSKGRLNKNLTGLGRPGALTGGCQRPAFEMFDLQGDAQDFCVTAYGLDYFIIDSSVNNVLAR